MFFTRTLLVVYKNTGGRLWNKPWGLPPLTKTQKRTRKLNLKKVQQVVETLRVAEALQPGKQMKPAPKPSA